MSRLPGPGPLASLRLLGPMVRRPYTVLPELHQRYGPVCQVGYGRQRFVFLFGPEANELILSGMPERFLWRDTLAVLIPIDGDTALVVSDGPDHQRRRRLVQPAFGVRRIESYLPVVREELVAGIDSWVDGSVVDVHESLRRCVLRMTIRNLFGDSLGARADELGALLQVGIDYVQRSPATRFDHDWPGTPYRRAMRARRAADQVIYAEISRRRAEGSGIGDGADILSALLAAQDDDGAAGDGALSDEEVRDQVVSLIAAGYDTTSAAVAWTLLSVATHPEVRERARAEVALIVGDDDLAVPHLAALPYLDAVVSESLRLHPPGPFSARKAIAPFELGGHTIPAGRMVVYSAYETQRDPDIWPDPLRFDPDRWIPGSPTHREPGPFEFVPFGGGYRRCIGFALATQEVKAALVEVLRRVDLEPLAPDPAPTGIATMSPEGGVPCRVTRRGRGLTPEPLSGARGPRWRRSCPAPGCWRTGSGRRARSRPRRTPRR